MKKSACMHLYSGAHTRQPSKHTDKQTNIIFKIHYNNNNKRIKIVDNSDDDDDEVNVRANRTCFKLSMRVFPFFLVLSSVHLRVFFIREIFECNSVFRCPSLPLSRSLSHSYIALDANTKFWLIFFFLILLRYLSVFRFVSFILCVRFSLCLGIFFFFYL